MQSSSSTPRAATGFMAHHMSPSHNTTGASHTTPTSTSTPNAMGPRGNVAVYNHVVPTRVVHGTASHEEAQLRYVRIKIQMKPRGIESSALHLECTDDADPFFLYLLQLDSSDFTSLKRLQDIKVDFTSFPGNLSQLLQLCQDNHDSGPPRFICELRTHSSGTSLSVIETNAFKNLNHICLSIVPGDNDAVKQYMADCLRLLQEEHENVKADLLNANSSIRSLTQQLEVQEQQHGRALEETQTRLEKTMKEQVEHWQKQVEAQKEQAMRAEETLRQTAQEMSTRQQRQFESELKAIESKFAQLSSAHKETVAKLHEVQKAHKQLGSAHTVTESELKTTQAQLVKTQEELQSERQRRTRLEDRLESVSKELSSTNTALSTAQASLRDAQVQLEVTRAQDKMNAAEAERLQQHATKLERTLQSSSTEIHKGNRVISDLQSQLESLAEALEERDSAMVKQEEVIVAQEDQLKELYEETRGLHAKIEGKDGKLAKLSKEVERLKADVAARTQDLRTKETLVALLNKRIKEQAAEDRQSKVRVPLGLVNSTPKPLHNAFETQPSLEALPPHLLTSQPTTQKLDGTRIPKFLPRRQMDGSDSVEPKSSQVASKLRPSHSESASRAGTLRNALGEFMAKQQ
eukprot:m.206227 g.206227  ORF g.206227 m.206227 type:complete len:634 (-) comp15020_c0_seq2:1810-3711(-)